MDAVPPPLAGRHHRPRALLEKFVRGRAGPALRGYTVGDVESLRDAAIRALADDVVPDTEPFNPDTYFDWMLGDTA